MESALSMKSILSSVSDSLNIKSQPCVGLVRCSPTQSPTQTSGMYLLEVSSLAHFPRVIRVFFLAWKKTLHVALYMGLPSQSRSTKMKLNFGGKCPLSSHANSILWIIYGDTFSPLRLVVFNACVNDNMMINEIARDKGDIST